ncbi:hypothetical protein [[Kitasatospora] papulosa]|uniref:Uncharacterized protein n=2 Tax=Streptomyces TaxID=1883 RepID=A0ABZ1KFU0_9ACTN
MNTDTRAAHVKALSALAVAKYRRLALAVNVILTALALLLTSALAALT